MQRDLAPGEEVRDREADRRAVRQRRPWFTLDRKTLIYVDVLAGSGATQWSLRDRDDRQMAPASSAGSTCRPPRPGPDPGPAGPTGWCIRRMWASRRIAPSRCGISRRHRRRCRSTRRFPAVGGRGRDPRNGSSTVRRVSGCSSTGWGRGPTDATVFDRHGLRRSQRRRDQRRRRSPPCP